MRAQATSRAPFGLVIVATAIDPLAMPDGAKQRLSATTPVLPVLNTNPRSRLPLLKSAMLPRLVELLPIPRPRFMHFPTIVPLIALFPAPRANLIPLPPKIIPRVRFPSVEQKRVAELVLTPVPVLVRCPIVVAPSVPLTLVRPVPVTELRMNVVSRLLVDGRPH